MRLRYTALLALLPLLAGCASDGSSADTTETPLPPSEGEIALQQARGLLAEGNAPDAMLELDTALDSLGAQDEVQFLRGVAALRLGISDGNAFFFEDAKRAFLSAAEGGQVNAAWFGAARASWMQFYEASDPERLEQALEYVQKGMQGRGDARPYEMYFEESPQRTEGEITFFAFTQAKGGVLTESRAPELFDAARDALEAEIGRDPTASWGWNELANLYLWNEQRADARTTIASALALNPNDESLHTTQVRLAEEDGTWAEVIRVYEPFVAEHDGSAIAHWFLGKAYYDLALETLVRDRNDQSAGFMAAEKHLRRTRQLEPSYAENCKGYEVISRDGLGWSHYNAGRLDEAAAAWWSMEELFKGGLRWEVKGQLFSGLDSLAFVVAAHNAEWEKGLPGPDRIPFRDAFPHLRKAAKIAARAFAYDENDLSRANNAGYFNRDFGVQLERLGVSNLGDDEERAAQLFLESNAAMEISLAAYKVAAKLAPDDCRTVNDTGLILAYYLQRDLERAEQYFRDAIGAGLLELKQTDLDAERRSATFVAIGDAYQNLGVVALTLRGDAKAAGPFFEQCVAYETQEDPRTQVHGYYLPLCEKLNAGTITPAQVIAAYTWGELTVPKVRAREQALIELRKSLAAN